MPCGRTYRKAGYDEIDCRRRRTRDALRRSADVSSSQTSAGSNARSRICESHICRVARPTDTAGDLRSRTVVVRSQACRVRVLVRRICGLVGWIATVVRTGFGKNPLQLAPMATTTNTPNASVNDSLRPVNIIKIASDSVILAECTGGDSSPVVHGWSRTLGLATAPAAFRLLGTNWRPKLAPGFFNLLTVWPSVKTWGALPTAYAVGCILTPLALLENTPQGANRASECIDPSLRSG